MHNRTNKNSLYVPEGMKQCVHFVQYARQDIRQKHPPTMHLESTLLASGLENCEMLSDNATPRTPQPSLSYNVPCSWHTEPVDEGVISPLELPPPLVSFGTIDGGHSGSLLFGSEATLDLEELDCRLEAIAPANHSVREDRRLESVARLERLGRAGVLSAFFASVGTTGV